MAAQHEAGETGLPSASAPHWVSLAVTNLICQWRIFAINWRYDAPKRRLLYRQLAAKALYGAVVGFFVFGVLTGLFAQ